MIWRMEHTWRAGRRWRRFFFLCSAMAGGGVGSFYFTGTDTDTDCSFRRSVHCSDHDLGSPLWKYLF
uniref:Putative secreted protein n=1 Tax=Anopheles darlingi TaxID=43151 RepID=A0A2M4DM10_ANODA